MDKVSVDHTLTGVQAELRKRGIEATLEYPTFIRIDRGPLGAINCGTLNNCWGADFVDTEDEVFESLQSCVSDDSNDPIEISDFIAPLVTRYLKYEDNKPRVAVIG
jgi:hypothetical protein